MFPLPLHFRTSATLLAILAGLSLTPEMRAQQDAPAVDVNGMIRALKTLREQQTTSARSQKQAAMQQISSAAGSAERSVNLWEDAIRATQMEGGGKEGAAFKAWRDTEGEVYKEREVQSAVHLQLTWLLLTLQRSNGAEVKDLLPSIINYTRELAADQANVEALDDAIKRDKEQAATGNKQRNQQQAKDGVAIKKTHDSILKTGVGGNPVAQWMKLADFLSVDKWEQNPGNYDGIFRTIILPELRLQKDARVFEYWDYKIKKEGDAAAKSKLAFEMEKYKTQRGPSLLWERAWEYAAIGQKNRAATEMYNLIKTYPTHPDAEDWIKQLEEFLVPPAGGTATPATGAAPATPPAQ